MSMLERPGFERFLTVVRTVFLGDDGLEFSERPKPFEDTFPIDAESCRGIGLSLATARLRRGLRTRDVADALLLSTRQVTSLETADVSAFYNRRFFLYALRKYAAFLGLEQETAALDDMARAGEDA